MAPADTLKGRERGVRRLDEAKLVAELCRGEPEARSRFYRLYHRDVLGWCRRLGCGLVDPEDAAQDVFVTALDRVGSFRAESTLGRWLFGLTRKVLANHRRKAQRRRLWEWLTGDRADREASPARSPAQRLLDSEKLAMIQRCLASLTPLQREVIVLCAIEQRSGKEAAELLGIPQATVYTRLHAARAAFDERAREVGLERPRGDGDHR